MTICADALFVALPKSARNSDEEGDKKGRKSDAYLTRCSTLRNEPSTPYYIVIDAS